MVQLAACEEPLEEELDEDRSTSDSEVGFPGYTSRNPLTGYVHNAGLCMTLSDTPRYGNIIDDGGTDKCQPILINKWGGPPTTDYVEVWTWNPSNVGGTSDSRHEFVSVAGRGRLCKGVPLPSGSGQLPVAEQNIERWGSWVRNQDSSNPNDGRCYMTALKRGENDHLGNPYGRLSTNANLSFIRQHPRTPQSEQYVLPGTGSSNPTQAQSRILDWKENAGTGLFRRHYVHSAAGQVKEFLPTTLTAVDNPADRDFCKVVDPLAPDYGAIGLRDTSGGCETPPAVKPGHETTVSTVWEPVYLPLAFTSLEEVTKTNYTSRVRNIVSSSHKYYPWFSRSLGTSTTTTNNLKGAVCMFASGADIRVGVTDQSRGCTYSSTSSAETFILPLFHLNRMPATPSEMDAGLTTYASKRKAREHVQYHNFSIDGHIEQFGNWQQVDGTDNINRWDINIVGDVRATLDVIEGNSPAGVPTGGFVLDDMVFEDRIVTRVRELRTLHPSSPLFTGGDSDEDIATKMVIYLLEEIPKGTPLRKVASGATGTSGLEAMAKHLAVEIIAPDSTGDQTMSNNLKLRALAGLTVRRSTPGGDLYADTRTVTVHKDANYEKWLARVSPSTQASNSLYPFYLVPGKVALAATVLGYLETYYGQAVAQALFDKNIVNSRKMDNAISVVFHALLRRGFAYGYVKNGQIYGNLMLDATSNTVNEVADLETPAPGAAIVSAWSSCPFDESLKISQCFENATLDDLASYLWIRQDYEDDKIYTQIMAARDPSYENTSFEFLSSPERTDPLARFLTFATDWYNFYQDVSFAFSMKRTFSSFFRKGGSGTFGRYVRPSKIKLRNSNICRAL